MASRKARLVYNVKRHAISIESPRDVQSTMATRWSGNHLW